MDQRRSPPAAIPDSELQDSPESLEETNPLGYSAQLFSLRPQGQSWNTFPITTPVMLTHFDIVPLPEMQKSHRQQNLHIDQQHHYILQQDHPFVPELQLSRINHRHQWHQHQHQYQ